MDAVNLEAFANDEGECESLADDGYLGDTIKLDTLTIAALDENDEPIADLLAGGLGPRGGGRGGAQHPVDRAQGIGQRNGLRVTSRKRSSGSTGSDHHLNQKSSDAVDLSNGSQPTPAMDRTARQIAALLGQPNWKGGVLNWRGNGYRVQLIYRSNVGGNHYNHVHVGVRVGG